MTASEDRQRGISWLGDRLTERSAEWYAALTDRERGAVLDWQAGLSTLLNTELRAEAASSNRAGRLFAHVEPVEKRRYLQAVHESLMRAVESSVSWTSQLTEPIRLYRGVRDKHSYFNAIARTGCVTTFESWSINPLVAHQFASWTLPDEPATIEV